jgi:histidinol-phosphate/aromatic aminotransferase/cobyric acid decarboxylase-like protein
MSSISPETERELRDRGFTRRGIAQIALGTAAALPLFHEFAYAQDINNPDAAPVRTGGRGGARGGSGGGRGGGGGRGRNMDPDAVIIGSNENPMGPTKEGLEAINSVSPLAWRYTPAGVNNELQSLVESTESVKSGYATVFPGSGPALAALMPAFASPTRSWTMGSPGYTQRGDQYGIKVNHVPLRKDYTHDVEAMIKTDPNAGVYYICNPNNPTGTITPRKDFEYILANKKKDAVLVIDEAYIHFSGRDNMSTDMVAADKDVIVLRTFSKIYGMAGLRAGILYGKPEYHTQVAKFDRGGNLSQGTMACAAASLKANATVIPERVATYQKNRAITYAQMDKLGVKYIPTVGNFFMMQVPGMTAAQVGTALQAKKIYVAGATRWAEWPNHIRVTVGSFDEMTKFNAALALVVKEGPPSAAKAG